MPNNSGKEVIDYLVDNRSITNYVSDSLFYQSEKYSRCDENKFK